MKEVRITVAVATVLRAFVDDPAEARYGYDLMRQTGFPSGKLYPILARLESAGWLVKERAQADVEDVGRPARRMYRITGAGLQQARLELAALHARLSAGRSRGPAGSPAPAGGQGRAICGQRFLP